MPAAKRFVLFPAILAIFILVNVRLPEYKAYFARPNASSYVVQLFSVLFAYLIAIIPGGRWEGIFRAEIFKVAIIFGFASGLIEVLTKAGEDNIIAFPVPQCDYLLPCGRAFCRNQ